MDMDQLRTFCQLAADGNYRIAAEHLCITQSALTKKIQRLEFLTGLVLFERGRQGAELTQAGRTLLPEAQRMLKELQRFQALTQMVAQGTRGVLNIGFGISGYHLAPACIARFKQDYPDIHITLNDMPSQQQTEGLLYGDLQLSYNRLPVSPPLQALKLRSDRLVIALHCSHTPDHGDLWSSLADMDYLQLNPARGMGLHQQIEAFITGENVTLVPGQMADDILTLLALVSADLGFTIVPSSARQIADDSVQFVALHGPAAEWDIGLIWNPQRADVVRDSFVEWVGATLNL